MFWAPALLSRLPMAMWYHTWACRYRRIKTLLTSWVIEYKKPLIPMGRKACLRGTTQITDLCPSLVRGITAPSRFAYCDVSAYSYRRIFRRVFPRSFHLYFALCKASTCLLFPVTAFSTIWPSLYPTRQPAVKKKRLLGIPLASPCYCSHPPY